MKVFFDLEFTGLHQRTTPISLAMRAQDGREFYAEFTDYDRAQVDEWVKTHVLENLILPDRMSEMAGPHGTSFFQGDAQKVAEAARAWLGQLGRVQMVGDCLAYDWVLLCELLGGPRDLPENVVYIPVELCTVLEMCRIDPDVSREALLGVMIYPGNQGLYRQLTDTRWKHNALYDTRVMAAIWGGLEYEASRSLNVIRAEFFRDRASLT